MKAGYKFEKGGDKLKSIHVTLETWTQLGINLITNLPKTPEGYNIITCIDYTSKFVESKPLIGKCAEGVAQFMYELVCHCAAARIHISNQGREFVNLYIPVHSELIHVFHIVYAQEFFINFISCMPKNCNLFFRSVRNSMS